MNTINNISMKDANFYINPKKRTVTCVIENTRFRFVDFVDNSLPFSPNCGNIFSEVGINVDINEALEMPNKFVGVAVCSEDDEFSEEIGKRIAFSRAKDKMNKSFFKRANFFIESLDDWLDRSIAIINRYGECLEKSTTHRHMKISNLLGEKEEENNG